MGKEKHDLDFWMEGARKGFDTEEMRKILERRKKLKADIKAKEDEKKAFNKELASLDGQAMEKMDAAGITKYFQEGVGNVKITDYWGITIPKTFDEKKLLFKWMKEQGEELFWTYAGVNSSSLNTLYNAEAARLKDEGVTDDFEMPGCGKSKLVRRKLS